MSPRSSARRSVGEARPRDPAREYRVPCAIHSVMNQADEAWRQELRGVSIAELMRRVVAGASPRSLEQGVSWMQEVLG